MSVEAVDPAAVRGTAGSDFRDPREARRPRTFLVWGAGGHGRVVADLIRAAGHRLAGFVDKDASLLGASVERGGPGVVATQAELLNRLTGTDSLPAGADGVALGIGDNAARFAASEALCRRSSAERFPSRLPPLIHPAAVVSPSAVLGPGTVVLAGAIVNAAARIDRAVIVNTGAIVEHDCVLESASHLSPGAVLGGGVYVGERAWVGLGARVIHGITIGRAAIVGAGAVVIRDVPAGATVVGVPAREL